MAEVDTVDIVDAASATQTVATASKMIKTIGLPADAKSTATDTTSVTHTSIFKQISASIQALATALSSLTNSANALDVNIKSGVNENLSDGSGQTSAAHVGAPTVNLDLYSQYETVAASQSAQVMGATGAQYDYLAGVLIIPGTAAAGAVSIADGNGSTISIFVGGGTTALPSLVPFLVPLGLHALAATSPGWKITTGANVTAIGIGKFT